MDAGVAEIHDHLLSVRGFQTETHGHMDEPSRSPVQTTVQTRIPVPSEIAEGNEARNAVVEGQERERAHPGRVLRPHLGDMRKVTKMDMEMGVDVDFEGIYAIAVGEEYGLMELHEWRDWFDDDEIKDSEPDGAWYCDYRIGDDVDGAVLGYRYGDRLSDL